MGLLILQPLKLLDVFFVYLPLILLSVNSTGCRNASFPVNRDSRAIGPPPGRSKAPSRRWFNGAARPILHSTGISWCKVGVDGVAFVDSGGVLTVEQNRLHLHIQTHIGLFNFC